jgi:hypothetical protein
MQSYDTHYVAREPQPGKDQCNTIQQHLLHSEQSI